MAGSEVYKLVDACLRCHVEQVHVLESGKVAEYVEENIVQNGVLQAAPQRRGTAPTLCCNGQNTPATCCSERDHLIRHE